MKIAYVMRSTAHFSYHRTTLEHLIERGHDVTLYFDPAGSDETIGDRGLQEWLARGYRVVVKDAVCRNDMWRATVFAAREARSYASYCRRGGEFEYYRRRWQVYLPHWLRGFSETGLGAALFRWPAVDRALTVFERLAPPSRHVVDALRRDAPDCLVASPLNMRFDEEVEYVKAARALGIPSVVPVLSWDNLTTKGLFHVQPDTVLAWNLDHHKEARHYHSIPAKRIVITGSPLFDKWFDDTTALRSRSSICEAVGLDANKPYLLYVGSSANVAHNESWLVIRFVKTLRKSDNPALRDLQVVFKPHPSNAAAIRNLDRREIPVWPRKNGMPDTVAAASQFGALIRHAACTVGINTTGMVDAVVCGVPTIAVTADQYKSTQADAEHFRRIVRTKAIYVATSVNGAVKLVGQIMAGKDPLAPHRKKFRTDHVRPRGLSADAGQAAAIAIEKTAARQPTSRIGAEITRELSQPDASRLRPAIDVRSGAVDSRERSILARDSAFDAVAAEHGARVAADYFRTHLTLDNVPVVIGLPLHNNARYLPEALTTLLAQDFRNFALFLLDDASTDDTARICGEFAARDPRIVYEHSAERLGMVRAWRETFLRARQRFPAAPYFAWASDHDRWDARWLRELHGVLERYPAVVLAYPRTRKLHANGVPYTYLEPTRFETFGIEDFDTRWRHFCGSIVGAGNMVYGLMRASALSRGGIFRPVVFPDRLLMGELTIQGQFFQVPEVLWHRRQLITASAGRQRRTLFGDAAPWSAYVPPALVHAVHLIQALRRARLQSSGGRRSALASAAFYVSGETTRKVAKLRLRLAFRWRQLTKKRTPAATYEKEIRTLRARIAQLEKGGSVQLPHAKPGAPQQPVGAGREPEAALAVSAAVALPASDEIRQQPVQPLGRIIREAASAAAASPVFAFYQLARDLVLQMMDEDSDYQYSAYWTQEAEGFDYLFDASPMVIAKLREHTYHITGLKSYEYRAHHVQAGCPFASKLGRLKGEDATGLFVPEAPELGGFGHRIDGAMVNMDTLKFYECLIALDRAGAIGQLRGSASRPIVLEIGAGWGGFAYQMRTLIPNVIYIIVDLPPTLLFSTTYLRAAFPDARMRIYGEVPAEHVLANLDDVDFVFVPAHALSRVTLPAADLAVNIASFQEMRTDQVSGYVNALADSGCHVLYSLNRDRSKWNAELTSVTDIMASRYRVQRIPLLDVPYTVLDWRAGTQREPLPIDYRHQVGRL